MSHVEDTEQTAACTQTEILRQLADRIAKRGLTTPVSIVLDTIMPVCFLASQVALFMRPFTPLGRWSNYMMMLEHEENWKLLHHFVVKEHQDG